MEEPAYLVSGPAAETDALTVPPHSVEAEQSVLGGLMLDNHGWESVADILSAEDFYRRDHRLIYQAISALIEENSPADVVTVSEWLEKSGESDAAGGLAYLGGLAKNTPSTANIVAYTRIVRDRAVLRGLIQVANRIAGSAYNPEGRSPSCLLDEAEKAIFEIARTDSDHRGGFRLVKEMLSNVLDRIDILSQSDSPYTGVVTGYRDLDDITSGLQPADLIVIAGRPAMGKTSLALNIAENAAVGQNLPVALFSMEMPGAQLAMRMLASLGRINAHKVRTGKLSDDDWPRLSSAVTLLEKAPIYIDDTPALTPMEIRARARRLARENEHGLGLIVVDYLQLMQSGESNENRATEISAITRSLKSLAKELNVPLIALSQLNRSLEQRPNKRPFMSDLRECVPGDTLVVLSDGRRVPIRRLVGKTPEVIALTPEGRLTRAKSDMVWSVGRKPLFAVRLASGRVIRATGKHRLLGALGWHRVEDLKTGDGVALAHVLPEPEDRETWPETRVALLGQLIGGGSYLKGQPMRYTTNSEENSHLVTQAVREEFGATVKRYRGRRDCHQLLISGNGNRRYPAGVNKWLRDLGIFGQRPYEKRVPESVFRLDNRQVAILLRHLWATDGVIYTGKSGGSGGHVMRYSTNSPGLATDVMALLLRLGIVARVQKVRQGNHRPTFMVLITGLESQKTFLSLVGGFGPHEAQAVWLSQRFAERNANTNVGTLPGEVFDRVRLLMQDQGAPQRAMAGVGGTTYGRSTHFRFTPSRSMPTGHATLPSDETLKNDCTNDLYWDRVVSIEACGEEEVFDLTVPGPASWLADGVVSHNSGAIEQDSDVILFIYRDEVYNEDSPDKGMAEIIIGKQRNGPTGTVRLTFLGEYTRFENYAGSGYGEGYGQ